MKNRERIKSMAIFDLLIKIRKNTNQCPIQAVKGFDLIKREHCEQYAFDCAACLQDWLNREENT